jgi:hypothetical protein
MSISNRPASASPMSRARGDGGAGSQAGRARSRGGARTGAILLDRTHAALGRYVWLPSPEAADALTLLNVATHGQPAWQHATRGILESFDPECGKSTALEISLELVHNPQPTTNMSSAALCRCIDPLDPPTFLYDEIDRLYASAVKSEKVEILTGILDSGFSRKFPYVRHNWNEKKNESFSCYAMAFLACKGLNILPDQLVSRAIVIRMIKADPGDYVKFRMRHAPALNNLRTDIHEWMLSQLSNMETREPDMPVDGRAADKWEPLIIVADAAGKDWPTRARKAAEYLESIAAAEKEMPYYVMALADMKEEFQNTDTGFISSAEMIARLLTRTDSPWKDIKLSGHGLIKLLSHCAVKPRKSRDGNVRGWRLEDLLPAFGRYVPPGDASESVRNRPIPGQSVSVRTLPDTSRTLGPVKCPSVSAGQAGNGHFRTLPDGTPEDAGVRDGSESPQEARSHTRGRTSRGRVRSAGSGAPKPGDGLSPDIRDGLDRIAVSENLYEIDQAQE